MLQGQTENLGWKVSVNEPGTNDDKNPTLVVPSGNQNLLFSLHHLTHPCPNPTYRVRAGLKSQLSNFMST